MTAATEEKDKKMDEADNNDNLESRPRRLRKNTRKEVVAKVIQSEDDDESDHEPAEEEESDYELSHENKKKKSKHVKKTKQPSRNKLLTRKKREPEPTIDVDEEDNASLGNREISGDGSVI